MISRPVSSYYKNNEQRRAALYFMIVLKIELPYRDLYDPRNERFVCATIDNA